MRSVERIRGERGVVQHDVQRGEGQKLLPNPYSERANTSNIADPHVNHWNRRDVAQLFIHTPGHAHQMVM